MARYVVMEPPGSGEKIAEGALIIRDGFHVLAFLAPPLWLLWNRLWIEAALALAAMLAVTALGEVAGFGLAGSAFSILLSLYFGLEAASLRIAALRRRDWTEWGALDADNHAEAEIRYAVGTGGEALPDIALPWQQAASPTRSSSHRSALGLLSYPGRP